MYRRGALTHCYQRTETETNVNNASWNQGTRHLTESISTRMKTTVTTTIVTIPVCIVTGMCKVRCSGTKFQSVQRYLHRMMSVMTASDLDSPLRCVRRYQTKLPVIIASTKICTLNPTVLITFVPVG